jgi:hypothetical protein
MPREGRERSRHLPQSQLLRPDNSVLGQEKEEKMKTKVQRIFIALAACALLNVVALAGGKNKSVTFDKDVKVGGTLVKKGTYTVNFDEQTKELAIISGKGVVAKSTAQLQERKAASKYATTYTSYRETDGSNLLLSVNMGSKFAVVNDQYTAHINRNSDAQ